jgi:hypothetical protein
MLGGCQASMRPISLPKNTWQPPGVSMPDITTQKHCLGFPLFFDLESVWQQPNIFYDFQSKKRLATTKCFLQFLIQKTPCNVKVFSKITDPKNP